MTKRAILFLFFLICTSSIMAKVELCNFSFLANSQEDPSTLFISYLDFLNEKNALEVDEFEEVLVRLESGTLINPFEVKEVSKENKAYGEIFQDYINVGIDEEKVKAYLESIVKRERQTAQDTERTKKDVEAVFTPIEFGVILPGSSEGDFGIDYSFEVMTTPVTYAHWNTVFGKPLLSEERELFDKPKTNINFFSQSVFADIMSNSKGLEPVFNIDLSSSNQELNAYDGNIEIKKAKSWRTKVPISQKEGYRLPTRDEQMLLIHQAQDFIGRKDFKDKIRKYAHLLYDQPENNIYPVGTKEAYHINNQSFYDIIGNVWETHLFESSNRLGLNYQMKSASNAYHAPYYNLINELDEWSLAGRRAQLGFRLVRTLKK